MQESDDAGWAAASRDAGLPAGVLLPRAMTVAGEWERFLKLYPNSAPGILAYMAAQAQRNGPLLMALQQATLALAFQVDKLSGNAVHMDNYSCVACGGAVVMDGINGTGLPCNHIGHPMCLRRAAVCPACELPFSAGKLPPPTSDEVNMYEATLARGILETDSAADLEGVLKQVADTARQDLIDAALQPVTAAAQQYLRVGGDAARTVLFERCQASAEGYDKALDQSAQRTAVQALAAFQKLRDAAVRPDLQLGDAAPSAAPCDASFAAPRSSAHAANAYEPPAKRVAGGAAGAAGGAGKDVPMDEDRPGFRCQINGLWAMATKFSSTCGDCKERLVQHRSLVAKAGDKYKCVMCAAHITSRALYERTTAQAGGQRADQDSTRESSPPPSGFVRPAGFGGPAAQASSAGLAASGRGGYGANYTAAPGHPAEGYAPHRPPASFANSFRPAQGRPRAPPPQGSMNISDMFG